MAKKKHIAVLMGGMSAEREVSLSSGRGISEALTKLGYKVTDIDVDRDVAFKLHEVKPDVAFIALHGTYGEDGCIQGLLEIMGIKYTHSQVLASAVSMDKQFAKTIFRQNGILCPQGGIYSREEILKNDVMQRPYVVKPISEGSSVGVILVLDKKIKITKEDIAAHQHYLVEKYIPGKELSVAVMGDRALGVVELKIKQGFYDYKHKYTTGVTEHIMPANIDARTYDLAMETALYAHKLLGCRGISRSDFRYDSEGDGKLYILETNSHPGMTPLSLVPEIASHVGVSFADILEFLIENASLQNKKL